MGRYNQCSQCTEFGRWAAIIKFNWCKDQEPDQYRVYRNDGNSGDKRSEDEICQQELKMLSALLAAAERGLKYDRKTGAIVQDDKKRFALGD